MTGPRTIHILIVIGIVFGVVAAHGILFYAVSHVAALPLAVLLVVVLVVIIRHVGHAV